MIDDKIKEQSDERTDKNEEEKNETEMIGKEILWRQGKGNFRNVSVKNLS